MAAGLLSGALVDLSPLKAAIIPLTMLMVYPVLVSFQAREAGIPASTAVRWLIAPSRVDE
jgi:hypothetical protein